MPDGSANGSRDIATDESEPLVGSVLYTDDDEIRISYARELVIEAQTRADAQRALNLISAAKHLLDGGESFFGGAEDSIAVPAALEALEGLDPDLARFAMQHHKMTTGFSTAAALAAKATHRRVWTVALVTHALSYRCFRVHSLDLDPRYRMPVTTEADPFDYLAMSNAITTAFSGIENLGLKIQGQARGEDGNWNSSSLAKLEKALRAMRIDPKGTTVWHLRGPPLQSGAEPLLTAREKSFVGRRPRSRQGCAPARGLVFRSGATE